MKRTTLAICFTVVCSLALVLYAQAPPPAQTPPAQAPSAQVPSAQAPASAERGSTTLTGCLKAGPEPDSFILTNIGAGSDTAQKSESAPGELAKTDLSYKLSADSGVKLKDHVGHKVEVTGTLAGKGFSSSPPASTEKPKAEMSNLKVTAIKHISPSCP
jgi:hypothetical protein